MRLSTDGARDEARSVATVHGALDAGVRVFDTARAYGLDENDLGHNERLVARALATHPAGVDATVITKGGMARSGRTWKPDGRATSLRADAEASAEALGRPIDAYLIHAPDTRVAWSTTLRELARLLERGVVKSIGVSNVTLAQLDQALDCAPIRWVQNSLHVFDDSSLRSGVLGRCDELGLTFLAHSPLGGPKGLDKTLRHPGLGRIAEELGTSPASLALAALLDLSTCITVIPGARRPETVRDVATASNLTIDAPLREKLIEALPALKPLSARGAAVSRVVSSTTAAGEVVLIMGLQGAGKSELVEAWVSRGYTRLNRDELGKTLDDVAKRAEALLAAGTTKLVLDNTYTSRSSRAAILDVAAAAKVPVRGVWLDIPLHEAQINVICRMLARHRRLLTPAELARGKDNTFLPPIAQLRMMKSLEAPTLDEGFAALETISFVRRPSAGVPAVFAAEGLDVPGAVHFAWKPGSTAPSTASQLICAHEGGPPVCWCRPPLPGLLLEYALLNGVNLATSVLHGTTETHQVLAHIVGAQFIRHEKSE